MNVSILWYKPAFHNRVHELLTRIVIRFQKKNQFTVQWMAMRPSIRYIFLSLKYHVLQYLFYRQLKADRQHPREIVDTQTPRTDNDSSLFFSFLFHTWGSGSAVKALTNIRTDRQTDGRYQAHYLPASRSIKIGRDSTFCAISRGAYTAFARNRFPGMSQK